MNRYGDFTNKQYLYKIFKKGYTSAAPRYITAGQDLTIGYYTDGTVIGDISATYDKSTSFLHIDGTGDSVSGLFATAIAYTDESKPIDLRNSVVTFTHGSGTSGLASVSSYRVTFADMEIEIVPSGPTISAKYNSSVLGSATYTSSYLHIRLREVSGVFYVDRSADGVTWTAWVNTPVLDEDLKSNILLRAVMGSGGTGFATAYINNLEAYDLYGNILAIESEKVTSDLTYTKNINNPASSTTIDLAYTPEELPSYIDYGNYVEIYTQFYDKGDISYEPILDQNSAPILDENSMPIYGALIANPVPENINILKFSGHIDSISKDYDNGLVSIDVVSHGEIAAQTPISDGNEVDSNVVAQQLQNASESSVNRRQTFTPEVNFMLNGIRLRLSCASGGSTYITIGQLSATLATTETLVWSGSLGAGVYEFEIPNGLQLEANTTYWLQLDNSVATINWYYQNADVYDGGNRQTFSGLSWSDTAADAYFDLFTTNADITFAYNGTISNLVDLTFDQLRQNYAPLSIGDVDEPGYNVNINASISTGMDMFESILKLSPNQYWYTIDLGTGIYTLQEYPTTSEHILILGRDFTGFSTRGTIADIVNDVLFIGGDVTEVQDKLAIRIKNDASAAEYKKGFEIVSNGKVTRYDTATLLADYEVTKNDEPRLTSEIFVSSSKYNTETIDVGQLVSVRNTANNELTQPLQIASMNYQKDGVSISLDSAPVTINATVDKIKRDLDNQATSDITSVI